MPVTTWRCGAAGVIFRSHTNPQLCFTHISVKGYVVFGLSSENLYRRGFSRSIDNLTAGIIPALSDKVRYRPGFLELENLFMIRKAFVLSVHPGMETEYQRRHNPVWQELLDTLKQHGVHNYSIFLHSETRQLFGYVEIEDEARWNAVADTPICRKWWAYMSDIMPVNPDRSPVSVELQEVFHLK